MKLMKSCVSLVLAFTLVLGLISFAPLTGVDASESSVVVNGYRIPFSGTLHIVGDSIADGYDNKNITDTDVVGWGNVIGEFFNDDIIINNQANCGDSTNSFYYDYDGDGLSDNTRYKAVYDNLNKNDYVFISFGHNDWGRALSNRGTSLESTETEGSFKWFLKNKFIDPVLDAEAVPILMTSVAFCRFVDGTYSEYEDHLAYAQAMRDLVAEYKAEGIDIILIDALNYTGNTYAQMTESEALKYHATNDTCHYNRSGALWISKFICSQFETNKLDISDYLLNPSGTLEKAPEVVDGVAYISDISEFRGSSLESPTADGLVFAGWYTDKDATISLDLSVSTGSAYAKFVDEDVLTVKYQRSKTNTGAIRLVTTVDSLKYNEVGFVIEGGTTYKTNTVYTSLNGGSNVYIPDYFCDDSEYFATVILDDLTRSNTYTITPYWITEDGTTVFGESRTDVTLE